jgi:hypothetical protein
MLDPTMYAQPGQGDTGAPGCLSVLVVDSIHGFALNGLGEM